MIGALPRACQLHLNPLKSPRCPWSHVAVDFGTGLPDAKIPILTVVDHFSKAMHYIPLLKLSSATETGDLLVRHVFHLHRFPRDMVLEWRPSSPHKSWEHFVMPWGTTVSLSSRYHPQSNGQLLWANQSLESVLRCVSVHHPVSWSTFLPWVEFVHDSLMSSTTGMSPFMAWLGYQPPVWCPGRWGAVPSVQANLRHCRVCLAAGPFCPPALIPAVSEAGNSVQGSSCTVRLTFWGDMGQTPLPCTSSCPHPSRSTPLSTRQVEAKLRGRPGTSVWAHLRPPPCLKVDQFTPSGRIWISIYRDAVSSSWWTGRSVALKSSSGFCVGAFLMD